MGASKPLLRLGADRLLARAVRMASDLATSCAVIGPSELREYTDVTVVEDAYPGCGPLGGIASALRISAQPWNLMLACDMPYLTLEWMRYLVCRAVNSPSDVMMAADERGWQPLCGMYQRTAGATIAVALEHGVRRVAQGLEGLNVEIVEPVEWKKFDPYGHLFKNVNTPEDYKEAREFFENSDGRAAGSADIR